MSGRVICFLVLLVIACELSLHTVECQCTTKHCFNDDNDVDIIKRFSYIQKEMGSLKEEVGSLKEETGSLKKEVGSLREKNGSLEEEVVSLKDEIGSLKEEVVSLKEQLSTKNTADVYIAPMPDRSGFYERTYNCKEWLDKGRTRNGWYLIDIYHSSRAFWVYCDMVTDGGGWLVFQRRQDGSVNFARDWRAYEEGFGGISSEFWLGNNALNAITTTGINYALRIDMEAFDADDKYAVYSSLIVASADEKYRMTLGSYTAGDLSTVQAEKFTGDSGNPFTTLDRDNERSGGNCAQIWMGGWWYGSCFSVNLNGGYKKYYAFSWSNYAAWLKKSEMKLRPT